MSARLADLLARHLYLVVVQATQDQWILWEHLSAEQRSGYYDLAYEIADEIQALREAEVTA